MQTVEGAPLRFACPRCNDAVEERLYGPCEACRLALRAQLRSEARTVHDVAFESKMHVTPNFVATRE